MFANEHGKRQSLTEVKTYFKLRTFRINTYISVSTQADVGNTQQKH